MYKFDHEKQFSFTDFNQPQGMQMNPNNRWVQKAAMIPWETIETEYAKLFPSHTGMPAKPLRMALGSKNVIAELVKHELPVDEEYHSSPYKEEMFLMQVSDKYYLASQDKSIYLCTYEGGSDSAELIF